MSIEQTIADNTASNLKLLLAIDALTVALSSGGLVPAAPLSPYAASAMVQATSTATETSAPAAANANPAPSPAPIVTTVDTTPESTTAPVTASPEATEPAPEIPWPAVEAATLAAVGGSETMQASVRALITSFGVARASHLDAKDYPEYMAKLSALVSADAPAVAA